MKYKGIHLNFRRIESTALKNTTPSICTSKSSPLCNYPYLYIPARENQVMCYHCLEHNNLLKDCPLLKLNN